MGPQGPMNILESRLVLPICQTGQSEHDESSFGNRDKLCENFSLLERFTFLFVVFIAQTFLKWSTYRVFQRLVFRESTVVFVFHALHYRQHWPTHTDANFDSDRCTSGSK